MDEAIVGKHIGFDNLGVVEEDIVIYDSNSDLGLVQSSNHLTVTEVVGVGNFVKGMSP